MQRRTGLFIIDDVVTYKQQMLNWANRFGICCFLDSHSYAGGYRRYDCLLAAGAATVFSPARNLLPQLKEFTRKNNDWLFGHISYDVKNEIESLTSAHPDNIQFPLLFFFQPQTVITLKGNALTIACINEAPQDIYGQISNEPIAITGNQLPAVALQSGINRQAYIATIQKLQQHILRGDCYEINFCPQFYAENCLIDPLRVYKNLVNISPTPFAAYYKLNELYALCASPERYLQKTATTLIAQPIKGTAKRDGDRQKDADLQQQLLHSAKDRSENVMITDLVRNDLSKISSEGSVQVTELFGIYAYPQVHQMITTITGDVPAGINIAEVLQATFPMGSMTGAPKRRVMQLIEQYETAKRGLYAGSIGYITPDNDFDFNVVIRSILYNAATQYISCSAGSAITFYSDAAAEYEECLLKAKAMQQALGSDLL